ncbi:MAG: GNAT family N-acetyltransferase [Treponema sp.]
MVFELTDELVNSIISALENQDKKFMVDAASNSLAEKTEDIICDEENYYELPLWNSADGFSLMEQFANNLHSPIARNDLQNVLHSGRGVFRGFKDVLKSYPEVEKKWHYFKNKQLIYYVNQWYNSLRETWGLEKLDYEIEETEDLLSDDFVFTQYDFTCDRDEVLKCIDSVAKDYCAELPDEISNALSDLWKARADDGFGKNACGFVCRSFSKEFAGSVIFAPCLDNAPNTVLLTSFFVQEKYRGLGIGRKLFEQSLAELKKRRFKWVLIANTIIPETITPLLLCSGFKPIGSGYIADLFLD